MWYCGTLPVHPCTALSCLLCPSLTASSQHDGTKDGRQAVPPAPAPAPGITYHIRTVYIQRESVVYSRQLSRTTLLMSPLLVICHIIYIYIHILVQGLFYISIKYWCNLTCIISKLPSSLLCLHWLAGWLSAWLSFNVQLFNSLALYYCPPAS